MKTAPPVEPLRLLLMRLKAGAAAVACERILEPNEHASETGNPDPRLISTLRARIPNSERPASPHPDRARELEAGDSCLHTLWKKLSSGTAHHASDLQLSLAHSAGWVLGCARLTTAQDSLLGIGVDLESRDRKIHEALRRKISAPGENPGTLEALEIWVVKEACFKSDGMNHERFVSQYRIDSFDRTASLGSASHIGAGPAFRFALHSDSEWVIALAVCGHES